MHVDVVLDVEHLDTLKPLQPIIKAKIHTYDTYDRRMVSLNIMPLILSSTQDVRWKLEVGSTNLKFACFCCKKKVFFFFFFWGHACFLMICDVRDVSHQPTSKRSSTLTLFVWRQPGQESSKRPQHPSLFLFCNVVLSHSPLESIV